MCKFAQEILTKTFDMKYLGPSFILPRVANSTHSTWHFLTSTDLCERSVETLSDGRRPPHGSPNDRQEQDE